MLVVIQKNSRQMPKQENIVRNKDYYDLVYSWFQCESIIKDNMRVVTKDKINYSSIGNSLGLDRRTVSRYIGRLEALGLLNKLIDGSFELKQLEPTVATLVPYPTLRQIQNSLHRNSVSIFVYLLNRFIANGEQEFYISYVSLKQFIGISTATASNNIVVSDIMKTLSALGLVEYKLVQTAEHRTNILIESVSNILKK